MEGYHGAFVLFGGFREIVICADDIREVDLAGIACGSIVIKIDDIAFI